MDIKIKWFFSLAKFFLFQGTTFVNWKEKFWDLRTVFFFSKMTLILDTDFLKFEKNSMRIYFFFDKKKSSYYWWDTFLSGKIIFSLADGFFIQIFLYKFKTFIQKFLSIPTTDFFNRTKIQKYSNLKTVFFTEKNSSIHGFWWSQQKYFSKLHASGEFQKIIFRKSTLARSQQKCIFL